MTDHDKFFDDIVDEMLDAGLLRAIPLHNREKLAAVAVNATIAIQALEIIAGEKQCLDNLMSHGDVAREALRMIRNPV